MTEWWELPSFKTFQSELKKSFEGVTIPVGERSDWETYWRDETTKHMDFTDKIIALETSLNDVVYDAFKLTPQERQLIEDATKYPYGAV
jgi:hypothetical protein